MRYFLLVAGLVLLFLLIYVCGSRATWVLNERERQMIGTPR